MRPLRLLGPALFAGGLAALAVAVSQGQATLNLFLVFPIVAASGPWGFLGILLLVAGFALLFLAWPSPSEEPAMQVTAARAPGPPPVASRRWGGVLFLGPIPVVFGSDAQVTRWMLVLALVLFVALLVLTLLALRAI